MFLNASIQCVFCSGGLKAHQSVAKRIRPFSVSMRLTVLQSSRQVKNNRKKDVEGLINLQVEARLQTAMVP